MNTQHQIAMKEHDMQPTNSNLIRWAGIAAMLAGAIFVGIQPIHPADALASVTTSLWAVITPLKTAMCMLFLLSITGLYARQAARAGWLGLAGFLMLTLSWALQLTFIFAEAFILPVLAPVAPTFVESFFSILNGSTSQIALGALPALYTLVGIMYIFGGLVFGIATLRARVMPRWAAGLLVVAAAITPAAALIPHPLNRVLAVPTGIAFVCLGYALWSERRANTTMPVSGSVMSPLS